jgi:hypothetical protein
MSLFEDLSCDPFYSKRLTGKPEVNSRGRIIFAECCNSFEGSKEQNDKESAESSAHV